MSDLSDLREKVYDLQESNARLEERVASLTTSVDALRVQLNPLIVSVAKGKGYLAAVALVSAAIGASIKQVFESFFK